MKILPQLGLIPLDRQLKGVGNYIRYRIEAETCRRLSFFFYPCSKSRLHRLVGLACDGKTVGCCPIDFPRVRFINRQVRALRGLCFAQTHLGQITAFKVKNDKENNDDNSGSLTWHGKPQHACNEVELHWIESRQDLVVHYDVSTLVKRSFEFVLNSSGAPKRDQMVHCKFPI